MLFRLQPLRGLILALAILLSLPLEAALKTDVEYYIWLNIYEKLMGSSEDGSAPALSAYTVNADADSYVFVAEASGKDGYVLLRQKSSGRYLAASGSNSYSIVFEATKSTDDRFCWKADEGTYTYLVNKKNGKYVGVDGANKGKSYVSPYYDKPKGSHSQMSIIPAAGGTWDDARQAFVSQEYTNAQGVKEIDYCQMNGITIDRSDAIDIHITSNDNPILGETSINLGSTATWLVLDNITPTQTSLFYLKHVTIRGEKAVNNKNCRIAIFLNGSAIIPLPEVAMECSGTEGDFTLAVGNNSDLGAQSNTMTSFLLKRGYMATLATTEGGKGYSRVYVADHADLRVTLPKALTKRVSSVNIKEWQYLSKKGWADTGGISKGSELRASWFWSWGAAYSSTNYIEYVPCKQHLYWPSASEVNKRTASAMLSLNEPEHPEQHESNDCSCGGTIGEWKACTVTPDFLPGGGRIGSPQPTDFSYLTNYFKHVDDMAYRCDFAVTHAYWDIAGRSENDYADWFASQCKSIYSNTGRPLWITEMEIGSSWGESWDKYSDKYGTYRKYLQVLLQKLEECDYVERYAIYSYDCYWSLMYYNEGGITPAGQVYRDHRSTFAYHDKYTKEPVWWAPSVKTPTLDFKLDTTEGTITFTLGNTNGDATDALTIQRMTPAGWEDFYTVAHRSDLEKSELTATFPLSDIDRETDIFRLSATTLYGGSATSQEVSTGFIANPNITTTSKSSVPGWTCERNALNGYTKAESGDTYLEVWGSSAAQMDFNYYQDLNNLPNGLYLLSAACFNSTNGEQGTAINGNVGLYALADGTMYFTPVTVDGELNYEQPLTTDTIVVRNGKMRIGIRNIGTMGGRWAGADNFSLLFLGEEESFATGHADSLIAKADSLFALRLPVISEADSLYDATGLIANATCSRGTTDRWNITELSVNSGEAHDGDSSNKYFDVWKSGAYTSSMTQTLGCVPEGKYAVSALVRSSSGVPVTLTATVISADGTEQDYKVSLDGTGNTSPDGSAYQKGWQKIGLDFVTVHSGDQLRLSLSFSPEAAAWWSVDNVSLSFRPLPHVPVIPDGIASPSVLATPSASYTIDGIPATCVFSHGIRVVKAEDGKGIKVMGK